MRHAFTAELEQLRMQVELMRSIESEKAADIVEEMDPDAAADLLGDLPEETSEEILEEMEPEEREEVSELLEYHENTAAGRMTTEFLALSPDATVGDAIDKLRQFEGEADHDETHAPEHQDTAGAGERSV